FGPMYVPDQTIVLHATTQRGALGMRNADIFDTRHFPVAFTDLPARFERVEDCGEHRIGSATIRHVELVHPGGATGFRIDDADGTSICYLTDNELALPADDLVRFAAGSDVLVHDAQYVAADMPAKRGWG